MPERRFRTRVVQDDGSTACALVLPFAPKDVFGKARAPVSVRIGAHTFRSTTATMGGLHFVPLNRANREAAGVAAGDEIEVRLRLDTAPRTVTCPRDLRQALEEAGLEEAWSSRSFTFRREQVEAIEEAKRPATRERRIGKVLESLATRAR